MEKFEFVFRSGHAVDVEVEGDGVRVNARGNFEVWRDPEVRERERDSDQEEPAKSVVAEFSSGDVLFWMELEAATA